MNMQFSYESNRYPPQPVIEMIIAAPRSSTGTSRLPAIIDTGADVTLIPLDHLMPLAAPVGDSRWVRSLWDERYEFKTFIVDVRIGDLVLPAIEVLGYPGDEIVLGRDVLNKLWLSLDGPQQRLDVAEKNPRRKR